MKLLIKKFDDLTLDELYDILRLRVSVFVVEQHCPYQEIDNKDQAAFHVFLKNENGIQAYARVLNRGVSGKEVSLGRVIAVKRHCGLGTKILSECIQIAKEKFHAQTIEIEAQSYAKKLYEKQGFRQISEEYLEDGIPHVKMKLHCMK